MLAKGEKVYLAADPDREGEAIAWHLAHALELDDTQSLRVVFNEITKTAVKDAFKTPRKINMDLVNARRQDVSWTDWLVIRSALFYGRK